MELDRFDWLARRHEEALDPDRVIVDAHHHLWERGGSTYLAEQLLADTTATHRITRTVFVECRSKYDRAASAALAPVGETRFVAREAARLRELGPTRIAAIVGFADMMLGDGVEEVLDAHVEAADGLFRGVRHATAWSAHPEIPPSHSGAGPGMLAEPAFRAGVARLGAMGHSFDAWLYHDQLAEFVDVARALPDVSMVLNHLGAPLAIGPHRGRRAEVDAAWRSAMEEVATCANVTLKLGGIGMDHYFDLGWVGRDTPPGSEEVAGYWADRLRWCIDTFGPSRCMFESNHPVDRQTLPYPVLWNAFSRIAEPYSDEEKDLLFAGTAARVYRLEDS